MKKGKTVLSKNAFNIAKNYTDESPAAITNRTSSRHLDASTADESLLSEQLEEQVMGEVAEANSQKSKVFERNLNQMVDVLHLRLRALESAARLRLDYCAEDLNPNSLKESKSVPKIMEEFEDQHVNPRILKEIKPSGGGGGGGGGNTAKVSQCEIYSLWRMLNHCSFSDAGHEFGIY
jgi:hypothetical protein